MSDLRSKPDVSSREQRRHSTTELRETVRISSNTLPSTNLNRSHTGTRRQLPRATDPESQEVPRWVHNPPSISPVVTLTFYIDPHLHAPLSLHWNNFAFLEKLRVTRLTRAFDQRRPHYRRASHLETRHMSMQFLPNVAQYPKPAESKLRTRTLLASDPASG